MIARPPWTLNASYSYYSFWLYFTRRTPSWIEIAVPLLISILWIIATIA